MNETPHGEPGHECQVLDASDALGGIIVHRDPDEPGTYLVDAWSKALSKRELAKFLRVVAASWEEDADQEDRAATAGLN